MGGLRREQRVRRLGELGFVTPPASAGWRERAGCAGVDPELFFPVGSRRPVQAQQICSGCPVREMCLADAMATEDPATRWGVLGGLTPTQRSHLFEQQRNDRTEVA